MYINPFVNQLLAEERMKDAMRHNERARLIRVIEGSKKSWRWQLPMVVARQNFFFLFTRSVNNLERVR